jgi:adenosylcobinamide-GDP ribazoletransferase
MGRQLTLLVVAVQFLTRLPTPGLKAFDTAWVSRAARYFPLVGEVVGAICAAVFFCAGAVWPPLAAALLAVAVGVLITGGFHEDGLADTADGLGGGQDPVRRLEIMKDSRVGTFGVLALVLTLALKVAALADLGLMTGALALLAAHGLARGASVLVMWRTPYVGDAQGAKWKPSPLGLGWGEVATAMVFAVWPLVFLPAAPAALGVAIGAGLALVVTLLARRLIGGQTGDVLGAVEQVFELGFLLGVSAGT